MRPLGPNIFQNNVPDARAETDVDLHVVTAKPTPVGGSARVSEAVARAIGARSAPTPNAAPRPRDPAPSRTAYRLNRLWLTPSFRFAMRRIVPVALVVGVVGIWFLNADNREALADQYAAVKSEVQNRPEFMVKLMAIDGASDDLSTDIREIVPIDFPVSSFDLDLEGMLAQIESLDAVSEAGVRVRAGGILQIDITERLPAVVWRGPQGLELLDQGGRRVSALPTRLERPDLPLLAGEGAQKAVAEALTLMGAAEGLLSRLRGFVRVGERRWDVVLDNDQVIMLPEKNPYPALARVIALNKTQDLLARDVRAVDMRNPNRPTVRVSEKAQEQLRAIMGL